MLVLNPHVTHQNKFWKEKKRPVGHIAHLSNLDPYAKIFLVNTKCMLRCLDMVEHEKKPFIKEGSHVTDAMVITTPNWPKLVLIRTRSFLSITKRAALNMHTAFRKSEKRSVHTRK
jgi:hypothetical protein